MNNRLSSGIDYGLANLASYGIFEIRPGSADGTMVCTYLNAVGQTYFPALKVNESDISSIFPNEIVLCLQTRLDDGPREEQSLIVSAGERWLKFFLFDGNQEIIAAVHDVTATKNAEKERDLLIARLQESNRELERFAWKASHELREPTRKIVSFGERLLAKYSDLLEGDGKLYLERMQQAALRMQVKIDALLEFAQVSRSGPASETVQLMDILTAVLANLEMDMEESKAVIQCDNLPEIEGHAIQLEQLFQNLLANAIKFRLPGTQPKVEIHCAGGITEDLPPELRPGRRYLCLEFRDYGIGFDQEDAERIFQLLERLHGRSEYEGSGIGLSICKKIVENHQGCIYAQSSPGKGATFFIWLPEKQDTPV